MPHNSRLSPGSHCCVDPFYTFSLAFESGDLHQPLSLWPGPVFDELLVVELLWFDVFFLHSVLLVWCVSFTAPIESSVVWCVSFTAPIESSVVWCVSFTAQERFSSLRCLVHRIVFRVWGVSFTIFVFPHSFAALNLLHINELTFRENLQRPFGSQLLLWRITSRVRPVYGRQRG